MNGEYQNCQTAKIIQFKKVKTIGINRDVENYKPSGTIEIITKRFSMCGKQFGDLSTY